MQGHVGRQGIPGPLGFPGLDGIPGKDGKDGRKVRDLYDKMQTNFLTLIYRDGKAEKVHVDLLEIL